MEELASQQFTIYFDFVTAHYIDFEADGTISMCGPRLGAGFGCVPGTINRRYEFGVPLHLTVIADVKADTFLVSLNSEVLIAAAMGQEASRLDMIRLSLRDRTGTSLVAVDNITIRVPEPAAMLLLLLALALVRLRSQ